ncbi:uncharacterized protein YbaA (DUF1428 family) [Bradyrhizobium japonicum]|uniref:DUF1428 domain-containing protein n=1 Tax=Bradyrhizobium TaxID=374 RepID=UPI00041CB9A5|nr:MULTISPECIES: DUF1428 domain-containing protein [Bradyrhizobium]MBR0881590.1 DUF1428 domain-containing protein [Bradyrhizobium liaoningense]MBR0995871.1 DUF1428 domain-containing protein [Bradyrhizobium liaoningense]MBR1062922.1 DUF1428 domain-containing protein [Bradyrhizobium liaoningense]MCP1740431.1 uncharacterized protein YbaA (DUF1428 family) [Bradyrhizobium japonicum]MCP1778672.1 uncharacterized protein YbaA (DUF1428 family) [Bradyrhizobium japonicum]
MPYVDGFVLAVPKDKIEAYKALARKACAVWMEHGALDYVECVGDDVPYGELTSLPRAVIAKEDEVVVFSWIVYRDRETRDAVNKKVMADERFKGADMPFDGKRMIYGGFTTLLRAGDVVG